jgi:hypothetical protein
LFAFVPPSCSLISFLCIQNYLQNGIKKNENGVFFFVPLILTIRHGPVECGGWVLVFTLPISFFFLTRRPIFFFFLRVEFTLDSLILVRHTHIFCEGGEFVDQVLRVGKDINISVVGVFEEEGVSYQFVIADELPACSPVYFVLPSDFSQKKNPKG